MCAPHITHLSVKFIKPIKKHKFRSDLVCALVCENKAAHNNPPWQVTPQDTVLCWTICNHRQGKYWSTDLSTLSCSNGSDARLQPHIGYDLLSSLSVGSLWSKINKLYLWVTKRTMEIVLDFPIVFHYAFLIKLHNADLILKHFLKFLFNISINRLCERWSDST